MLLYQQKQLYDQVINISNIFNPSSALQYNGINQFMINNNSSTNPNENNGNINETTPLTVVNDYINQLNQVMQQQQQQQQPNEISPSLSLSSSSSSSLEQIQLQNQQQIEQTNPQQKEQQQVLPIPVPCIHKTKTPSSTIQNLAMYKSTVITPDIMQNKINNNNSLSTSITITSLPPSSSSSFKQTVATTTTTSIVSAKQTTPILIQQQQQQQKPIQPILPPPQQHLFNPNILSELDNKFINEITLTSLPFVILDCTDITSPIIFSSLKIREITGYKENELYMQHIPLFYSNDTNIQIATVINNTLKYRIEMCVCYKNYRKCRTSFWNHLYLVPLTTSV